jgi:hypothetical protein
MLWQARLGMICGRGAIDAPAGGGSIWATFDGATANVTMSNGNLTATMNSNSAVGGARSTSNKSSGKYYFEFTAVAPNGFADAVGIILSTGTFVDMQSNQLNTSEVYLDYNLGQIFSNSTPDGQIGLSSPGDVAGVAIDLDNRKAWFRRNAGNWNNDGSANPATNTNGLTIASGSFAPAVVFSPVAGSIVTGQLRRDHFQRIGTVWIYRRLADMTAVGVP